MNMFSITSTQESNNQHEKVSHNENFHGYKQIKNALQHLGLNLSDSELQQLQTEKNISLENKTLDEIGSFFILAAAIYSVNLGKNKITLRDLRKIVTYPKNSCGIPIYTWQDISYNKHYIYLSFIKGKLMISI